MRWDPRDPMRAIGPSHREGTGARPRGPGLRSPGLGPPAPRDGLQPRGSLQVPPVTPGVHAPSPKFPVEQYTNHLSSSYKQVGETHQLWAHCASRSLPSSQVGRAPHF